MVERQPSKLVFAGSIPATRSRERECPRKTGSTSSRRLTDRIEDFQSSDGGFDSPREHHTGGNHRFESGSGYQTL